jgi:hypothetical protein
MLGVRTAPQSVEESWYTAGTDAFRRETDYPTLVINFRVVAWPDAWFDNLGDVSTNPGTGDYLDLEYNDVKVHPVP